MMLVGMMVVYTGEYGSAKEGYETRSLTHLKTFLIFS
jgi:hypothetical protein